MQIKPKLIIGLGNDDPAYTNTYHNVGHMMADFLREKHPELKVEKNEGYMNEAGAAVKKLIKKYSAKPEQTLIIHDDSDIYLGDYKFSFERGSAGHKGVQSIFDTVKNKEFWRLRIGIRPKPKTEDAPRKKAGEFVLKKISSADKKVLEEVFAKAALEISNA